MMRLLPIIAVLVAFLGGLPALGAPSVRLSYESYEVPFDFSNLSAVLIMQGDAPEYRLPAFDDSPWNIVSLPNNWNRLYPGYTGICWYRIHIVFPARPPMKAVGISLGEIIDADQAYFNGELIGSTGSFSPRRSDYDRKRIYEIPQRLIRPGTDNVLALRVAGKFYDINGAYQGSFVIAPMEGMQRSLLAREFFDVFFMVIYVAVSVYFFLLFFKQRDEREYLFFSLFSLSTGIYLFLRTQVKYFLTDNFIALKRTEYVILFLIFIWMMEYLTYHFDKKHTPWHFIYPALAVLCMPVIIFTDDLMLWHKVLNWIIQPAWVIPVSYYLWVLIKEFRRDSDAKYMLSSCFILLLAMINDTMVHRGVYQFIRLSNYGFLFLIIGVGIIMRNRYVALTQALEEMKQKGSRRQEITSYSQNKVEEAIAYLNEHVTDEVTREDMAANMGLHPDHLGKMFKRSTGKTINDYLNGLRIQETVRQILETDAGITHIAYAVGFESLATFYRVFQKEMGESPTAYRERVKAK